MNGELDDKTARKFAWGLTLVWAPFILLFVPTVLNAFHGVSEQKAIGMGAIAGIMAGVFATFGLIVAIALEMIAIVILIRTISKRHVLRGAVAVISICCGSLMIFTWGAYMWLILIYVPRHRP